MVSEDKPLSDLCKNFRPLSKSNGAEVISTSGYAIDTDGLPTPVDGISWIFYTTFPYLESIVNITWSP